MLAVKWLATTQFALAPTATLVIRSSGANLDQLPSKHRLLSPNVKSILTVKPLKLASNNAVLILVSNGPVFALPTPSAEWSNTVRSASAPKD
jgi:hypothetical protein